MRSRVKLGSLLKIQHGYAFKSENYVPISQYRLVTLGNFNEGSNSFKYNDAKATYYGADFPDEFILKNGDLIMPLTEQVVGLFGNTAFVPAEDRFQFVLNQRVGKVICDETKIDKTYLHFVLATKSVKDQLEARANGTKQRNISPADVYDVVIELPDMATQIAIGSFLHNIELKIENNAHICSELESMAKTIYDYWFTQFDFPNAEGKPYRSSGGKMVWNEQLKREIPEGWEVLPVTQCYDVCYGFPFNTELFTEDSSAQPLVRIRDILENTISAYTTENVDERYWLHSGDMIIGMDGNFHINFWDSSSALLNQRCVRIRSTGEYPVLMAYFSAIPYIKSREKTVSRTTVGHLSADDIKALYILRPDNITLSSAKMQFDAILKKLCQARDENRELQQLRNWLLPMLMNGQAIIE